MGLGQFTVKITPDLVNGDVSNIIDSDKSAHPFQTDDILFDWVAMQVPRGANKLVSITGYMMGKDGGEQLDHDIEFIFAKSVNGVAPTSLGAVNEPQTGCFELPLHFIGFAKCEGTASITRGAKFGDFFTSTYGGGANGAQLPIVIEGETTSGQNVGYDTIYVAAFIVGGVPDFTTAVLLNDASSVADDAGTSLTIDGSDPRKSFQVGDTVYIHDVDTPIGTVASMTFDGTDGTIVLTANNVGAIANNDEFVNANPVRVTFGFEK